MRGLYVTLAVVIGIGLSACQLEEGADPDLRPVDEWDEAKAETCRSEGGDPTFTGFGLQTCIKPTADAGKSCSSSDQCETLCLAETRSCAPSNPMYGCHQVLEKGIGEVGLCID